MKNQFNFGIPFVLGSLLVGTMSFASEIPQGKYVGKTSDGQSCSVKINVNDEHVFTTIEWRDSEGQIQSCGFFAKDLHQSTSAIKMEGGSEASVCKARVHLTDDGYPLEADLGIGLLIQWGYDVTCTDLNLAPEEN